MIPFLDLRAAYCELKPEIDAADTKLAKSICLAIYESALVGQPIKVQDVFDGKVSAYQDPINEHWGI